MDQRQQRDSLLTGLLFLSPTAAIPVVVIIVIAIIVAATATVTVGAVVGKNLHSFSAVFPGHPHHLHLPDAVRLVPVGHADVQVPGRVLLLRRHQDDLRGEPQGQGIRGDVQVTFFSTY